MPIFSLNVNAKRATRTGRRSGFTTLELMVTLGMAGFISAMALPSFTKSLTAERMRAAKTVISMQAAVARETAVARGCLTTLHFTSGADARIWITSCKTAAAGLDTVGAVDRVGDRLRISLSVTNDSVRFSPTGLRADYETTQVSVTLVGSGATGALSVNQLGKVVIQ